MEAILVGLATAFNFIIIKWKIEKSRAADATLDIGVMVALGWMFGGTMSGMVVAMIASVAVSLYLLKYPPTFMGGDDEELEE